MKYDVRITAHAERDLVEIYDYVFGHSSGQRANELLNQIEGAIADLATMPERGAFPKELLDLGIREYREVFVHSLRIVYYISAQTLYIVLITDGRRDLHSLLLRRLIG